MSELIKIELVGTNRYNYKSKKFERGVHYMVKADRAKTLLKLTTDHGLFVFKEVGKAHTPVAPQPVRNTRRIPVVDTTKTPAEQHDQLMGDLDAEMPVEIDDTEDSAAEYLPVDEDSPSEAGTVV
jgi:hypothetical protein